MNLTDTFKSYFGLKGFENRNDSCPLILDEFNVDNIENGLILLKRVIPEEMIVEILSYVNPKEILRLGLVCKNWYNITRSHQLWARICEHQNRKGHKLLPWYLFYCLFAKKYFDTNLIKNGNGQNKFKFWEITHNGGDGFKVEDQPQGANVLPLGVLEFDEHTSCFATSYHLCAKHQVIEIKNKLFQHIVDNFKPHIYISEWVTGRFDCASRYKMTIHLLNDEEEVIGNKEATYECQQWENPPWSKVVLTFSDYPAGLRKIVFKHEGQDRQFWSGHYGTKMTGAVVKFEFDSVNVG